MTPCPTGHRCCDCCQGTSGSQAIGYPWGKDQGSPLLHGLVGHYPLCISPLPSTVLRISVPPGIPAAAWQHIPGSPGLGHCQTCRGLRGEMKGIPPPPCAVRVLIPSL